jgi:hypothetical protein
LHDEFQTRGDRNTLHYLHLRVVQLEDLIVETDKSLAILRDDLAEQEAQTTRKAQELGVVSMLPDWKAPRVTWSHELEVTFENGVATNVKRAS